MYARPPSNTRTVMSCVSAAGAGRAVLAPRASAGSGRASRAVVRASGGSRGRVTARRARVVTRSVADEDLDAQGTPRFRPSASPPRPSTPRRAAPPRAYASRRISAKRVEALGCRAARYIGGAAVAPRDAVAFSRTMTDTSRRQTAPKRARTPDRRRSPLLPVLERVEIFIFFLKQPRRSSRRSSA